MSSPRHWGGIIGSPSRQGASHVPFLGGRELGLAIVRHVNKARHPSQAPRFVQELRSGRSLEKTEATGTLLVQRRRHEEKMRQETEEQRLGLEAETRRADKLKQVTPVARSHHFSRRDNRARSRDHDWHRGSIRERQASSGRQDHRGRSGSGAGPDFSIAGFDINISRKR